MKIVYNRGAKIKYDRLEQKISFFIAAITTIVWLISIVVCCSPLLDFLSTELVVYVILASSIFCPVVAVAGWLFYWNCRCYLKRLERYGYEVPDWKRNYRGGLESLKRQEISPSQVKCADGKILSSISRESVALAAISWVISVGFLLCYIPFLRLYQDMKEWFVFFAGLALCWIIAGAHYFRQRLRTKYKDDVEPETGTRKIRVHFSEGIITIVVSMVLSIALMGIFFSFAGVVHKVNTGI